MSISSRKFIALEGIDGCGKSSVLKELAIRHPNIFTVENPADGPHNKAIQNYLQAAWLHDEDLARLALLFGLNTMDLLEVVDGVRFMIGRTVICSRWNASAYAYHLGRTTFDIMSACIKATAEPDLTIVLHVPIDVAMERIESRGEPKTVFEKRERLIEVDENYRGYWYWREKSLNDGTRTVVRRHLECDRMTVAEQTDAVERIIAEELSEPGGL